MAFKKRLGGVSVDNAVIEYKKRRQKRLDAKAVEQYRIRRDARLHGRMDADGDEESNNGGGKSGGGHGNTRIPFGLCQREGIQIDPEWEPSDAWDALAGKGYSAGEVYKELKKSGKVPEKKTASKPVPDLKKVSALASEHKTRASELKRGRLALREADEEISDQDRLINNLNASIERYERWANESTGSEREKYERMVRDVKSSKDEAEKELGELKNRREHIKEKLGELEKKDEEYKEAVDSVLSDHPYAKRVTEYRALEEDSEEDRELLRVCDNEISGIERDLAWSKEKLEKDFGGSMSGFLSQRIDRLNSKLETLKKNRESIATRVEESDKKLAAAKGDAKKGEWKQVYDMSIERDTVQEAEYDKLKDEVSQLRFGKVKYNSPRKYAKTPDEDRIVNSVGGADKTRGSCASLALAYAANKAGYKVLDFRGGKSQEVFSRTFAQIVKDFGGTAVESRDDMKATNDFLAKAESGKEYALGAGRHAAIVRVKDGKREYLELQDERGKNGWKELNDAVLRDRFGAISLRKREKKTVFIEISKLTSSPEFISMLGYINTDIGKQEKGVGGGVK